MIEALCLAICILTPLLAFLAFVAGFKAANASLPEGCGVGADYQGQEKPCPYGGRSAGSNPSMRTLKTMGRRSHKRGEVNWNSIHRFGTNMKKGWNI